VHPGDGAAAEAEMALAGAIRIALADIGLADVRAWRRVAARAQAGGCRRQPIRPSGVENSIEWR